MGWGRIPAPLVSDPTGPVKETKSCNCTDPETALPLPVMSWMEKLVEVWNCGPELSQSASPHCLVTRKSSVLKEERFSAEGALVWKNTFELAAFQEIAAARWDRSCWETPLMTNCTFWAI